MIHIDGKCYLRPVEINPGTEAKVILKPLGDGSGIQVVPMMFCCPTIRDYIRAGPRWHEISGYGRRPFEFILRRDWDYKRDFEHKFWMWSLAGTNVYHHLGFARWIGYWLREIFSRPISQLKLRPRSYEERIKEAVAFVAERLVKEIAIHNAVVKKQNAADVRKQEKEIAKKEELSNKIEFQKAKARQMSEVLSLYTN